MKKDLHSHFWLDKVHLHAHWWNYTCQKDNKAVCEWKHYEETHWRQRSTCSNNSRVNEMLWVNQMKWIKKQKLVILSIFYFFIYLFFCHFEILTRMDVNRSAWATAFLQIIQWQQFCSWKSNTQKAIYLSHKWVYNWVLRENNSA